MKRKVKRFFHSPEVYLYTRLLILAFSCLEASCVRYFKVCCVDIYMFIRFVPLFSPFSGYPFILLTLFPPSSHLRHHHALPICLFFLEKLDYLPSKERIQGKNDGSKNQLLQKYFIVKFKYR
jgi:hypothetical protein